MPSVHKSLGARLETARTDTRGFTLIELTIAMALFSLFTLVVFNTLTGYMQIQNQTIQRFYSTSQAQVILDSFLRNVRTAPASVLGEGTSLIYATNSDIVFNANITVAGSSSPTPVVINAFTGPSVQGSGTYGFTERYCSNYVAATATCVTGWVGLLSGDFLTNPNIFTYFLPPSSPTGSVTTSTLSLAPLPIQLANGAQLSASQLASVAIVGITVTSATQAGLPGSTLAGQATLGGLS